MFPLMFDRIMENSMALWLPVSAAYFIFAAGMIVKAIRHFRRARAMSGHGPGPERPRLAPTGRYGRETADAPEAAGRGAGSRARDWSPAR